MKILCQMKNENLTSKTNEVPDGNKSLETWTDKFIIKKKKKSGIQGYKSSLCYIKMRHWITIRTQSFTERETKQSQPSLGLIYLCLVKYCKAQKEV